MRERASDGEGLIEGREEEGRGRTASIHEHICLQAFIGTQRTPLSCVLERKQTLLSLEDIALQICENAKAAFSIPG